MICLTDIESAIFGERREEGSSLPRALITVVIFSAHFCFFQASQAQSWQQFLTLPQSHTPSRNNKGKHSSEVNLKNWLPSQYSSRVACQAIQKAYKKCLNSSIGTSALNKVKCSAGKGPLCSPVNTVLARSWACSGLVVRSWPSPFSNLCLSSRSIKWVQWHWLPWENSAEFSSAGRARGCSSARCQRCSASRRLAATGQFGRSFALSSHPSWQCLPHTCSLLSLHHEAALLGSCLRGQPPFSFAHSISDAHAIIRCYRMRPHPWSPTASLHRVPRPLSPACLPLFSKSPATLHPHTTSFSFAGFISHNPAHGSASKKALPHHTVLLSHPHIHAAHSFPATTYMRERKTGSRGAWGHGHTQLVDEGLWERFFWQQCQLKVTAWTHLKPGSCLS